MNNTTEKKIFGHWTGRTRVLSREGRAGPDRAGRTGQGRAGKGRASEHVTSVKCTDD